MVSGVLSAFKRWEASGVAAPVRERLELAAVQTLARGRNRRVSAQARKDANAGYPGLRATFRDEVGYDLNLENPITRNEKIQWRKVFDRRPLIPVLCDKYHVKQWVGERVGHERIVPTLHRVSAPWQLPRDIGSKDVILKCTHASGAMILCGTPETPSFGGLNRRLGYWLHLDYGVALHEWGYAQCDRSIIAEPILLDRAGHFPRDAKFHMHDGELLIVQLSGGDAVLTHEKVGHETVSYLTPDWEVSDVRRIGDAPNATNPVPAGLEEMKAIAAELSKGMDYLRVDFLLVDDTFYIGELTLYSSSGLKPFETYEMDKWLGDAWTLPSL